MAAQLEVGGFSVWQFTNAQAPQLQQVGWVWVHEHPDGTTMEVWVLDQNWRAPNGQNQLETRLLRDTSPQGPTKLEEFIEQRWDNAPDRSGWHYIRCDCVELHAP